MKFAMIGTALLALWGCGEQAAGVNNPHLDDFFWSREPAQKSLQFHEEADDCRVRIKNLMCLAETFTEGQEVKCEEGGQAYAGHFEKLYDAYPPVVQRMFCSLKVIYVLRQFQGTAFAGLVDDGHGNVTGAQMGIRKSVLDQGLNLTTWASWKEQLSFGGVRNSFSLITNLPHVTASIESPRVNDFLYFVIAHEFGHIFDFANKLNRLVNCAPNVRGERECDMEEGSWGALSWKTNLKPLPQNEFINRDRLCFYKCDTETIPRNSIPPLYAALYDRTSFISTYAATDTWQEFADSFAYYLMHQNQRGLYILDTMQGRSYDVMEKFESDLFAKHRQYIEDFLARTDIVYP